MSHPASRPRVADVVTPDGIAAVDHAIISRRSIRRFLPTPVERATIEEMRKKPSFVQVTGAGQRESHVHDGQITKEPPNYRAG